MSPQQVAATMSAAPRKGLFPVHVVLNIITSLSLLGGRTCARCIPSY